MGACSTLMVSRKTAEAAMFRATQPPMTNNQLGDALDKFVADQLYNVLVVPDDEGRDDAILDQLL